MTYTYYCERCRTTFQLDEGPDADQQLAETTACPRCEYPHAFRAFAMPTPPPSSDCAPGSGC